MKYEQAKPLVTRLIDIAILYHAAPSMLRTKIYDALNEYLPDMDEGCRERGCIAVDNFKEKIMPFNPHPTDPALVIYKPNDYWIPRLWQGLTEDEVKESIRNLLEDDPSPLLTLADVIQERLKEKNGG
jgi:hypothetical protein